MTRQRIGSRKQQKIGEIASEAADHSIDRSDEAGGENNLGQRVSDALAADWEDPDWALFDDRRGDLPQFPVDALTLPWRKWLDRASHGAGVRPEHVIVPLIGIVSALIGTARRIRASSSWTEPMTLWACVVANSGDRKTPGLNVTLCALDRIEKNNSAAVKEKLLDHKTQVTLFVTPALPKIHVPSQVQILRLEPAKSLMWLKVILTPFPRF